MRKNYTQTGTVGTDSRIYLDNDWYSRGIPGNVDISPSAYIDTSYGFAGFLSLQPEALKIEEGTGCYDRASMIVAAEGTISVGKYTILNGTTLICKNKITIGNHCMLAWGSVLVDCWLNAAIHSVEVRKKLLQKTGDDLLRPYPFFDSAAPIVLEDNCWVGFDAVILPGVTLGHGCVVGCKTIVDTDVPPYAVVAGSPAKIIKYLEPSDTHEVKQKVLKEYSIKT